MSNTGIISLIIIIANFIFSYKGFTSASFFEAYNFRVDRILINKEYRRLLTSGFLHVSWTHLIFNMITLYFFSGSLEWYLGSLNFLLIYFASLLGGNLLTLFIHRNHGRFSSVGASGAISGIVFAVIALFPGMRVGFFFLPAIPSWIYGLIYVLYSIYGIRSKKDNVGHEAHLGGGLVGMVIVILLNPSLLQTNTLPIILILLPSVFFIYVIIRRPHFLLIENRFYQQQKFYSIDHRYNAEKINRQKQIDAILEKIHKKGMNSLSKKEKEMLSEYSKTVR